MWKSFQKHVRFQTRQYNWSQMSRRGVEDGDSGEPLHADVEETRVGRFVDGIWCGISNRLAMQAWRCLLTSSERSAAMSDMLPILLPQLL